MFDYQARRYSLAAELREREIDALFVSPGADLEYLAGIRRDIPTFGATAYTHGFATGGFFRPDGDPVFVVPRLFALMHMKHEVAGEVVVLGETDDGNLRFAEVVRRFGHLDRIAIGETTRAESVLALQSIAPAARLVPSSTILNRLRRIKSPEEIAAMTRACEIAEQALDAVTPLVRPGLTMRELCAALEGEMLALGSQGPSFTTHTHTFGHDDRRDSADPATATLPLRSGESVKFDYGAVVDGYCSDFGRTLFCGEPSAEFVRAYEVLLSAQNTAIAAASPGATAGSVDLACRAVIEAEGWGEWFVHRTGHCIGLDVHELPFISLEDTTELQAGMTYTIEPSINFPGHFGMRIEDIVMTTETGAAKLTGYPSELVVVSA